jgi:large subunit ribosomal protein L1
VKLALLKNLGEGTCLRKTGTFINNLLIPFFTRNHYFGRRAYGPESLKKAREGKQRNFSQSFELIVNLRDLDLKKPEHQVEFYFRLPKATARKKKVCALVDADMVGEAKANCDGFVPLDDFQRFATDKKRLRKLAAEYDYFLAQATVMPKVAAAFGRVLGPKGKMPNPKAGMIFPPKAALKPLCERFRNTVKVSGRKAPILQCLVGTSEMKDEDVAENCAALHEQLVHALPAEAANIRSMYIKMTMGKPVKLK